MAYNFSEIQHVTNKESGEKLLKEVYLEINHVLGILKMTRHESDIKVYNAQLETLFNYIDDIKEKIRAVTAEGDLQRDTD